MIVASLALVAIGIAVGEQARMVDDAASLDWLVRVYQTSGLSIGLLGIGLFFWGCRCFARG